MKPKIFLKVSRPVEGEKLFIFECGECEQEFTIPVETEKEILLNCHQLFWQAHYACGQSDIESFYRKPTVTTYNSRGASNGGESLPPNHFFATDARL